VPVGRLSRALSALALLCASLVGSLLLAEALFRVYERRFLVQEVVLGADDFDLAALHYNDAEGFVRAQKPPGEFRILSFGDSFAESATRAEYAYAAVLQKALTRAAGRPVRVVNFGVAQITFQDYLQEERTWGERVEHDAVLFDIYAGNDFSEVPQHALFARGAARAPVRRGEQEVRLVGPGVDVPHRYPLRLLDHAVAQYLTYTQVAPASDLYREHMPQMPAKGYAHVQAGMSAYYRPDRLEAAYGGALYGLDTLISRAAALQRQGMRVALSVAPPHFAVSRQWLDAVLAETGLAESDLRLDLPEQVVTALARRRGFRGPLIAFGGCLRDAEARGQDTYYGTNTHWSARGNEIVGHVLAERLAAAWKLGNPRATLGDEPPPPCDSNPPAPSPEVQRWLDWALPRLRAATQLRDRVGAALTGDRFARFADVSAALGHAGLKHLPGRIRGRVESAAARGTGRVTVRVRGSAVDSRRESSWLLVALFRGGELRGIGLTPPPGGEGAAAGAFQFDVIDDVSDPFWSRGVIAAAIAPDGAFAELPVEIGALDLQ